MVQENLALKHNVLAIGGVLVLQMGLLIGYAARNWLDDETESSGLALYGFIIMSSLSIHIGTIWYVAENLGFGTVKVLEVFLYSWMAAIMIDLAIFCAILVLLMLLLILDMTGILDFLKDAWNTVGETIRAQSISDWIVGIPSRVYRDLKFLSHLIKERLTS